MQDEVFRKLIYYSDTDPYTKPDISPTEIYNDRLKIFEPKIININESGTYITIRPSRMKASKGGHYIKSNLCFDIICHQDSRKTIDGDRVFLIIDRIEELLDKINFSIGKSDLDSVDDIRVKDNIWSGYSVVYKDIDWRNTKSDG